MIRIKISKRTFLIFKKISLFDSKCSSYLIRYIVLENDTRKPNEKLKLILKKLEIFLEKQYFYSLLNHLYISNITLYSYKSN
ncbi:hypothetical protein AOE57_02415 [Candidatus Riesia pediculicola]|nr:hypothetical protein AOE57_02415 [Candidatus Riesia pediculicola]